MSISLEPGSSEGLPRPVLRYDEVTGKPIYKEKPPATAEFDRAVTELFELKPGKFSDIEADNVHQWKNGTETGAPRVTEEPMEEDEQVAIDKDVERRKELSAEEMGQLRHDVNTKLFLAWGQMMKTSEIIRSLIPGHPHPYVAPEHANQVTIPPDSLTMVPSISDKPPPTNIVAALDLKKMILARNRKGLSDTREGLVTRAAEMRVRMAGEHEFWDDLKSLAGNPHDPDGNTGLEANATNATAGPSSDSNKVWSLRPRWRSDKGISPENQIASDVMIPYAPDEAAPPYRSVAIATLDPPTADHERRNAAPSSSTIKIPARRRRRLRLCIRTSSKTQLPPLYSTLDLSEDSENQGEDASISQTLESAGQELFEEEIYHEIRTEAKGNSALNARISLDSVIISAVPDQELVFVLVNLDDLDHHEEKERKPSAKADLILSIIKMSMLKIYRERKAPKPAEPEAVSKEVTIRTKGGARPKPAQATPGVTKASPTGTILGMLVPYLHYQAFLHRLLEILIEFKKTIASFGLDLGIRRKDSGEVGGLDWASLVGGSEGYKDGSIDVTLEGRQIVSLTISSSSSFTLVFPNVYLPSSDMTQLPSYISRELRQCLVDIVEEHVHESGLSDGGFRVAKDHLVGSVSTAKTKIVIDIGATSAETSIKAYILRRKGDKDTKGQETTIQHIEEVAFDGVGIDKGSLLTWVHRMVFA